MSVLPGPETVQTSTVYLLLQPPLLSPLPGASQQTEARDSPSPETFSEDVGQGEKGGHPLQQAPEMPRANAKGKVRSGVRSPPASTTSLTEWGTKSQSTRDKGGLNGK